MNSAVPHPDGFHYIVVAGGQAYVIDPNSKAKIREFGGSISDLLEVDDEAALIFGNGLWLERLGKNDRLMWQTKRISWDGMRDLQIQGDEILGEAFTPMGNEWIPFSVNLFTGEVKGGTYDGPASKLKE